MYNAGDGTPLRRLSSIQALLERAKPVQPQTINIKTQLYNIQENSRNTTPFYELLTYFFVMYLSEPLNFKTCSPAN